MRLCGKLRAGLPSRHRNLRRGAELKNRSPYRYTPLPQEHVCPKITFSDVAILELFRPEARVCMGRQLANACISPRLVGDAISVAEKKIYDFRKCLNIFLSLWETGDRFPRGSRSPPVRDGGDFFEHRRFPRLPTFTARPLPAVV